MAEEQSVDEFIDDYTKRTPAERYARWVLSHFRLPATLFNDFREFMSKYRLFCTYGGARYRVTGASRLGDVFLHSNPTMEDGYELRVPVSKCSNWSRELPG